MHSAANFVGADRERVKIASSEQGRYESAQQLYERARGAFGAGLGSAAAVADAAAAAAAAAVAASALPTAPPTPLHRRDLCRLLTTPQACVDLLVPVRLAR